MMGFGAFRRAICGTAVAGAALLPATPVLAQSSQPLLQQAEPFTALPAYVAGSRTSPNCISLFEPATADAPAEFYATACFFQYRNDDQILSGSADEEQWVAVQAHEVVKRAGRDSTWPESDTYVYGLVTKDVMARARSAKQLYEMTYFPRLRGSLDGEWLANAVGDQSLSFVRGKGFRFASPAAVTGYLTLAASEIEGITYKPLPDDRCKYAFWSKTLSFSQAQREFWLSCRWRPGQ